MTKGDYPYPPDEFDDVEPDAGPRGAHRSRRSRWRVAWPFLLVIVLFPALAYGAVSYWSSDRGGASAGSAPAAPAAAETPAPSSTATGGPTGTTSPTQTPEATAPASAADRGTPVLVFNATPHSGIAADAAKALSTAGWTSVTPKNYTGAMLPSSTVLYGAPDLADTAQAAAQALGITTVKLVQNRAVDGLEVVLEEDYKP